MPRQKQILRTESDLEWDKVIGATVAFVRGADCRQNQAEFAQRFNISRSLIANIESGRTPLPAYLGWSICHTLNINPSWLLSGGKDRHDKTFPTISDQQLATSKSVLLASRNGLLRQVWPVLSALIWEKIQWVAEVNFETSENALTEDSLKSNNAAVKSEIQKLIEQVKRKASNPGAKAELARELDVAPARISEWLSGKKEPGGDYALRLQKWVKPSSSN